MDLGFEDKVANKIYSAAVDDSGDPSMKDESGGFVQKKLLEDLSKLKPGKQLASSPLVKVMEVTDETVTFLIRGRMELLKSDVSVFVRIEATIGKIQLSLDRIRTFVGELHMIQSDVTPINDIRMGLGYDGLIFMGRGAYRLVPVGFGLDIFLGGVSSRGIMLGIDVYLPAPIPLGPTGVGLNGLGGDYAHNFKPRLEAGLIAEPPSLETGDPPDPEPPQPIEHPTAVDYARWARNPDEALDRWVAADNDEKTNGIAIRAMFCDMMSNGSIIQLDPVGVAVLLPGPVIILGGKGKLLRSNTTIIEAYLVLEGASRSWSLAGGVKLKIPESGKILDGEGSVEAFFSLVEPRNWFLNFGTRAEPNKAEIIDLLDAKAFLQIDNRRITFGVDVTWHIEAGVKKILTYFLKGGLGIFALIGWNPRQFGAEVSLHGEAGVKIWKFTFSFTITLSMFGHVPKPKVLRGTLTFKVKLPFPLPDPKVSVTFPDEKEDQPPDMEPGLENEARQEVHAGALHGLTGRQWDLDDPDDNELNQPWPDIELVVHFSRRTTDGTGKILGEPVGPENNGGYEVEHLLTELQIFDLTNDAEIENVEAVWAEAPDGTSGQLHVLAQDPYSWLFWSKELTDSLSVPPPEITLQRFGIGVNETLTSERRFGDLRVQPQPEAELTNTFSFILPTRTISADSLRIAFDGGPVDRVVLYVMQPRAVNSALLGGALRVTADDQVLALHQIGFEQLSQGVYLIAIEATVPAGLALEEITIETQPVAGGPSASLYLYAVFFRKALQPVGGCQERVILNPGRYRLHIAGETSAESLHDLSNPEPIPWELTREFQIAYPLSLRPYLKYTTVGDSRIFRNDSAGRNPTLYAIGFPAYRAYLPVLRFLVPYVSRIFETLTVQIRYVDHEDVVVEFSGSPAPNADGETRYTRAE